MKCFFCQIEITNEFVICDLQGRKSDIRHLDCQICKTKYAYNNKKDSVIYYRIFGYYKEKKYVAHFSIDRKDFYLGDASGEVAKIIFQLNFLPKDITPENFPNKLPTYLIFS